MSATSTSSTASAGTGGMGASTTSSSSASTGTGGTTTPSCSDGLENGTETDIDCGGACPACANGKVCAVNVDCQSALCTGGVCKPQPPVSWADCSVGVDPTKNGGELLWVKERPYSYPCAGAAKLEELALGPTGDIAVGMECSWLPPNTTLAMYDRLNGAGALFGSGMYSPAGNGVDQYIHWDSLSVGPYNDLFVAVSGTQDCPMPGPSYWCPTSTTQAVNAGGQVIVPSGQTADDPSGNLFKSYSDTDQQHGRYLVGALPATHDFGCGPLVPTGPSSGYVTHLDQAETCTYSRVLPISVAIFGGASGATLSVTSSTGLDLGCGTLPAAPGGSTFVTRLDPAGGCVFGKSLAAPNLAVVVDAGGRTVVSGLVGAAPVDLGGGPLAPIGSQDFVVGELDATGNLLWSRRFGAPGVTLVTPTVSISAAGDVYLKTGWSGAVDLGGGPLTAAAGDIVVGSYSPSGAHRWSRDFAITGSYLAGIDACGALVVASSDSANFNPGNGVPAQPPFWYAAIARFAP